MPTQSGPPLAACLALGALALLSALPARAQTVSDSFSYPAGSLNGDAGGTGFSGAWNSTSTNVTSPGSTYPGLATAGNAVTLTPPAVNTSAVAFRPLTTTFGADGTTVYLSFLAQATNSGSRFLGLSLFSGSPGTTGTEQLFVGKLNGFGTFGITSGSGSANTSAPSATLSLLVARIDFVTGPDTVTLYVNPTVGAPEPAASTTLTGFSIGTFDYLRLAAGAGNSTGATSTVTGTLDELRIGNTFASVTPAAAPEPSPLAATAIGILGLGALALKARRRAA